MSKKSESINNNHKKSTIEKVDNTFTLYDSSKFSKKYMSNINPSFQNIKREFDKIEISLDPETLAEFECNYVKKKRNRYTYKKWNNNNFINADSHQYKEDSRSSYYCTQSPGHI